MSQALHFKAFSLQQLLLHTLKVSRSGQTSHSRWHTGRSPRPSLPTTSTAGLDSLNPRQSAALASLPAPNKAEEILVIDMRCW